MKTLILVRHAKSSWKDPRLTDFERPLNRRGKKNAPFMGGKLKERGVMPNLILSSPAKRAKKTATIIAKEIGYPKKEILYDPGFYHYGADFILRSVQDRGDQHGTIMIVGHNPDISDLADMFLKKNPAYHMPTAGIHVINCHVKYWKDVNPGCGESAFYDYPKRYSE